MSLKKNSKLRNPSAFTLVELICTLALISLLLAIAAPSLRHVIAQNQVAQGVNQIIAAMNFARSEAVKRGVIVTFCKSSDHKKCSGAWNEGQIVMVGDEILRVYAALPSGDELTWRSSLGKNEALQWAPTGFTVGQKGSFYYCSANKRYGARIVVEQTGRIRVEKDYNCE